MPARKPAVAGHFYPGTPGSCRNELEQCLSGGSGARPAGEREGLIGGIVPHAGWTWSGAVAAEVLAVLAAADIETFVVFGAVHRRTPSAGSVYGSGAWGTPLGEVAIDEELAAAVVEASPRLTSDVGAHAQEHSIEVQVPFLKRLAPRARLLPILVTPAKSAPEVGRVVADRAQAVGRRIVVVGSTDLTHYGPGYGFTPQGVGGEALAWAKEVNDRRMLDLILGLKANEVVAEAERHRNACGAGAVAATLAAATAMGATQARLLRHTTSSEVLGGRSGRDVPDAVGYAGVVFGRAG